MESIAQLHPLVIHFPIVLFIIYAVFEISGVVFKKDYLSKAAYILLIFGVLSASAAVLSGNQAGEIAKSLRILPSEILEAHEEFATISLLYFFAILVFRTYFVIKKKFVGTIKIVFVVLSIAGCFFIFITGKYGGELVFKYGVGTEVVEKSLHE